mmetsp:Transcript_1277/g.1335  ORF Transcript_1277/g.1335 Transcript_1277/m.1335 type:complete len:235 (-) Transcript_1277:528-1232(-)
MIAHPSSRNLCFSAFNFSTFFRASLDRYFDCNFRAIASSIKRCFRSLSILTCSRAFLPLQAFFNIVAAKTSASFKRPAANASLKRFFTAPFENTAMASSCCDTFAEASASRASSLRLSARPLANRFAATLLCSTCCCFSSSFASSIFFFPISFAIMAPIASAFDALISLVSSFACSNFFLLKSFIIKFAASDALFAATVSVPMGLVTVLYSDLVGNSLGRMMVTMFESSIFLIQ